MTRFLHKITDEECERILNYVKKIDFSRNAYGHKIDARIHGWANEDEARIGHFWNVIMNESFYLFYEELCRFYGYPFRGTGKYDNKKTIYKDDIYAFNEELEEYDNEFLVLLGTWIEEVFFSFSRNKKRERIIHTREVVQIKDDCMDQIGNKYYVISNFFGRKNRLLSSEYTPMFSLFAAYCDQLLGTEYDKCSSPYFWFNKHYNGTGFYVSNAFSACRSSRKDTYDFHFNKKVIPLLNNLLSEYHEMYKVFETARLERVAQRRAKMSDFDI